MEKKLSRLFDFQKFENNPRLSALIQETETRYMRELTDEELYMVTAAGDPGTEMGSNNLHRFR